MRQNPRPVIDPPNGTFSPPPPWATATLAARNCLMLPGWHHEVRSAGELLPIKSGVGRWRVLLMRVLAYHLHRRGRRGHTFGQRRHAPRGPSVRLASFWELQALLHADHQTGVTWANLAGFRDSTERCPLHGTFNLWTPLSRPRTPECHAGAKRQCPSAGRPCWTMESPRRAELRLQSLKLFAATDHPVCKVTGAVR